MYEQHDLHEDYPKLPEEAMCDSLAKMLIVEQMVDMYDGTKVSIEGVLVDFRQAAKDLEDVLA